MHITYIYGDYKKYGFAPGLALGRRGVNELSRWRLQDLLLHENLVLILLNNLLELMLTGGHDLHRLVLYMHAMTMMQLFSI